MDLGWVHMQSSVPQLLLRANTALQLSPPTLPSHCDLKDSPTQVTWAVSHKKAWLCLSFDLNDTRRQYLSSALNGEKTKIYTGNFFSLSLSKYAVHTRPISRSDLTATASEENNARPFQAGVPLSPFETFGSKWCFPVHVLLCFQPHMSDGGDREGREGGWSPPASSAVRLETSTRSTEQVQDELQKMPPDSHFFFSFFFWSWGKFYSFFKSANGTWQWFLALAHIGVTHYFCKKREGKKRRDDDQTRALNEMCLLIISCNQDAAPVCHTFFAATFFWNHISQSVKTRTRQVERLLHVWQIHLESRQMQRSCYQKAAAMTSVH